MSVEKRSRRGKVVFVVDVAVVGKHGSERYRRDALIQTTVGAEAEERRVHQHFLAHDTIQWLLNPEAEAKATTPKKRDAIWDDAVKHWKAHQLQAVSESTRKGYEGIRGNEAFKAAWDGKPLAEITYSTLTLYFAMERSDAELHVAISSRGDAWGQYGLRSA